ncbi:hypothetical protein MO973_28950 [Paenibacillus sp. TRM 82003]|uniref:hypothetical protein n=1 Tax=Kineococcus sp. TRM81007 TaxID=2925831 RepID=UPI001F58FDE6|nr:hypothetical protein [Kineococcus sp. TRM81007]MCI2238853.1 hypothetical protein [Kineococcus sp. TRM81007]MCI3924258.1 hypothetical protein [Paenibacillus sp. TRM 82003]
MNGRGTTGERASIEGGGAPPRTFRDAVRLPGRWTPVLLLAVAGLSAVSLLSQVLKHGVDLDVDGLNTLERWFFVDREMGIPAWFSTLLLFAAAERLWQTATAAKASGDRWHRHWRLLSIAFAYLSLDELTEIHEQTIPPLKAAFGFSGVLAFAWVVLAVPLLVVFGLVFLRFLLALPRATRWAFLVSAALYCGGAVGVEMLSAPFFDSAGVETVTTTVVGGVETVTHGVVIESVAYAAVAGVEEALEMVGSVLFLGATAVALRQRTGRTVTLPVAPAGDAGRVTAAR